MGEMLPGPKRRQKDSGQRAGREKGITPTVRGPGARCGQGPGSCWEGRQGEAGQLLPSAGGMNMFGPQLIHWDACGTATPGVNGVWRSSHRLEMAQ